MHADIVYLHPPRNSWTPAYLTIPAGLFGVVNNLRKHGYSVIGYNIPMEMIINNYFSIENVINTVSPRLVLIDLHWYEHASGAIETAIEVKKASNKIKIILGGLTSTIFAKEILQSYTEIDYIVKGEAEEPLLQLVDHLIKRNRSIDSIQNISCREQHGIFETPVRFHKSETNSRYNYTDFSWLNNYAHYLYATPSGMLYTQKTFWLLIANGCLFDCTYCGGSKSSIKRSFKRDKLWLRDYEEVANDIIGLWRQGVEVINPTHDISIFGNKYWGAVFQTIKEKNISIGVYIELFQLPSDEFLKEFSEVFNIHTSTVVFSPLSGSECVRNDCGKNYTNVNLLSKLRLCRKLGLKAELAFSKNLPGMTENSAIDEKKLLEEADHVYPGIQYYSQQITLDPLSKMARNPDRYGIKTSFKTFRDYVKYTYRGSGEQMINGFDVLNAKL